MREPQRFAHLFRSPAWSSPLLAGAVAAAVAHLVARLRSHRRACDEILACSLAVPAGGLAAIESTKAPLYAVALLPALCLLIAPTLVRAAQWCGAPDRRRPLRAAALAGLMAVAGTIATDALRAYRIDRRESREASRYVDAGRRIESLVPPAATVLGPHRWWWALRDRKYRSLPGLWWQWRLAGAANNPQLADAIAASSARYLIVDDDIRSEIASHPELLQQQFRAVLDRSVLVAAWDDRSYSSTEIYAITPSADARPARAER